MTYGWYWLELFFFFFQAEDGIRDVAVTGVQTCALPIFALVTHLEARLDVVVPCHEHVHASGYGRAAQRRRHGDLDARPLRCGVCWECQGDGEDRREGSETQQKVLKRAG